MPKKITRGNKNAVFLIQVTDNFLKVIKCNTGRKPQDRQFSGLQAQAISADIEDKELTQNLSQALHNLEYNSSNPVVVSLPRGRVTCRTLKIPTQTPKEIEGIITLQAPRFLPYPANELISGYQIISTDNSGYSEINLIIVHKDVIERYLHILHALKIAKFTITLSSFGLVALYSYMNPQEAGPVMVVDIDSHQVELAISSREKLFFSRFFKIPRQPDWQSLFAEEVRKTQDAYLKEGARERPKKIALTGPAKNLSTFQNILSQKTDLPVETVSYTEKIKMTGSALDSLSYCETSFANLIGLGLKELPESLSLLLPAMKEKARASLEVRERLRQAAYICGIIFIFGLGVAKNIDNKALYINRLKAELRKIEEEARPLEEIEKRVEIMEGRAQKKPSSLDVLYEVHQIIPQEVSLVNLIYEEDNQVILRGQTAVLAAVFAFVSRLEKSAVFQNFNIKVRYATKRVVQAGEIIDFEIACTREEEG
jgi:Tfp pilus assembly PilM family ATPase